MPALPPDPVARDDAARHQEALRASGRQRGLGAFYTPLDVVEAVAELTLAPILDDRVRAGPDAVGALRVVDPACGTGNFVLVAHRRIALALEQTGLSGEEARRRAVACVAGIDLDPEAVALCRQALGDQGGVGGHVVAEQIVEGDGLLPTSEPLGAGADLVVGNPPFLSQLDARTARTRDDHDDLRQRFGPAVSAFTDPAWLFLLAACELARPAGGVVAMVEPVSILAARDAGGVRAAVSERVHVRALWVPEEPLFSAAVEVCILILDRQAEPSGPRPSVTLLRGRSPQPSGTAPAPAAGPGTWSGLLGASRSVPRRSVRTAGVLGDVASASADFRDQYYGLVGHVVDRIDGGDGDAPPLVTVGAVDPAALLWGQRQTRFAKQSFTHPRVVVAELSDELRVWARRRLVPKVLVATQTRAMEAYVDVEGGLLPSVPVISVVPVVQEAGELWRVGALLMAPAVALVATERHGGSGRSTRALRLRAEEVLALPMPVGADAWTQAAGHLRQAQEAGSGPARRDALVAMGRAMNRAYGLGDDDQLLAWWWERLPQR